MSGLTSRFLKCLIILVGFTSVLARADEAPSALAIIQKAGKLVIALDPSYPPMESEDMDGKLIGFDVDVGRELAKRLGVKAEFMVMGWEGIIGGLVSNRYDVIVSSMNITADRQTQIDFVEYVRMSQMIVAKKGLAIKGEQDLAGKIVAVPTDTTSYDYIQTAKSKGLAVKEIRAYRLASEVFMAVKTGHADALVVDEPVARYFTKLDAASFSVAGRAMAPEPIGVGLRKTAPELREAVTKAIQAMKKDGTMKRLSEAWFGGELGV